MPGTGCREFLSVRVVNGCLQTLAARENGAHGNFAAIYFDYSARLFEKCAVPTSRLQTPRAHEDATFNYDGPDADEAMRLCAGSNTEDLSIANGRHDLFRVFLFCIHPPR